MKKQLLCTLAFCSALGAAQAQTDVTGKYLVNPSFETLKAADGTTDVAAGQDLENGLYGWDIPSADQSPNTGFYNRRVESQTSGSGSGFGSRIAPNDGTYYYYNRQGWGTFDAELKTTTSQELPVGNYYVVIDYKAASFANNGNQNSAQTGIGIKASDASGASLGENPVIKRSFSVVQSEGSLSSSHFVDADWDKVGTMFTVTSPSAVTFTIMEHLTGPNGRGDILLDNMKLYRIDEVSEEGIDVSGLISNYNDYNLTNWTIDGGNTFQINTWSHEGETDGSGMVLPFIQDWVGSGNQLANADISYTLSGLVPGIYEVGGLIRALNEAGGDAPTGATLYANDGTTDACAGTACTNGVYGTYAVQGIVGTDGVLKFGIRLANANFNWISFKDFTLKYLGEAGTEELKATLATLIGQAQSKAADCPAAVAGIINTVISQAESAQAGTDADAMNASIEALNGAILLADAVIPAANELEAAIAQNQSVLEHSTANNDETATAYQSAIQSAKKALDEATEVTAITEAIASLEAARQTYVQNAAPKEGYPFDYNFLVESIGNSTSGWTRSVTEGNSSAKFVYKASTEKNNGSLQADGLPTDSWNAGMPAHTRAPSPIR